MTASAHAVVSYNVHGCRGTDGRHDLARTVAVVARLRPAIAGLQEVDSRDGRDVWSAFERELGMHTVAGHTLEERDGRYGNLLLSRWTVRARESCELDVRGREPRRAIDALVEAPFGPLRVVVTHLGLARRERREQLARLAAALQARWREHPVLVLGDFNEWLQPRRVGRALGAGLQAAALPRTFPARAPCFALDQIWSAPTGLVTRVHAAGGALARRASDHLPVVGRLEPPGGAGG